jgi:uncharacterized surface protein with fasciclin (FAS1) repeats
MTDPPRKSVPLHKLGQGLPCPLVALLSTGKPCPRVPILSSTSRCSTLSEESLSFTLCAASLGWLPLQTTSQAMVSIIERDSLPPANIISTLQATSGLTTLNQYINGSARLLNLLGSAQQFTFLAPSDTAFKTWLASQSTTPSADLIEATLSYHLLNGSFPTVSFTNQSQFVQTYLTNSSYSNITISPPGQRVELISTGQPEVISNNRSISNIVAKVLARLALSGL